MDKDTALDLALGALEVGWSPTYTGLDAKEMGMKAITAIKQARSAPVQPVAWPAGLIDRIKAAEQRIQDGHAPRRIPADPTDVDLVLAEVRYLLEGKQPPFWIKTTPPAQPAPVQKPYRPLQDNGSQYFGGSWDTLPTQSAPVQEPVAWVDLLKQAEEVVRSKSLWKKYIDGTPLANDIAVWMASFAQEHTTLPAQPAPVQPETDLCGSGAGCLYKVAMIEHLESEVEHLKAAQPAPVQEPVIDHSCKDTYELIMKWADIYAAQTGNLYAQAAQDPSKVARMADERTMLACVVAQAISQPPEPDLLSALKRILDEPNNTMSDGKALKEIIRIARRAITKATGEKT